MLDTPEDRSPTQIPEPPLARFLFADTRIAWVWLITRLYCGYAWLEAGWGKIQNPALFWGERGQCPYRLRQWRARQERW